MSTIGQAQHAASSSTVGHGRYTSQDIPNHKRKTRPVKGIVDARDLSKTAVADRQIRGNEANTFPQSQSHLQSQSPRAHKSGALKGPRSNTKVARQPRTNFKSSRPPQKSQAQGTIAKKVSGKKKKQAFFSDARASDHADQSTDDSDDDAESGNFPTFVAASDLSPSSASDSSDSCSDSSSFDSDSSLEAEEESYILAEQRRHDKARVRRELLGDDSHRHNDVHNNNWVIRPRKKSVGLSDVDMDGDSDDLTEEEEDDAEEDMDDDEEDEETDGQAPSVIYTGLATGWSEDEESSFDADIFFANLSDTNTDESSSEDDPVDPQDVQADDAMASSISSLQRSTDLEMTEGWDGQIVFTNGCDDGQGVLDLAFEATAAQLLASDTASISQDSDVEMGMEMGGDDEGDYEEVDSVICTSDGETTEEELVDANGLPTSRAMRLFRWPTSVSSINPLSTVSPAVSPAPRNRRSTTSHPRDSPRPADILARKVFCDESDHSQPDSGGEGSAPSPIRRMSRGGIPIMGQFEQVSDVKQKAAILTGSNKDIPSPFPRLAHRRRRIGSSSGGSFSSMDIRDRTSRLTIFTPSSTMPPPSPSDDPSSQTTPEPSPAESIELDDVLESSYLDYEPEMPLEPSTASEGDFQRHLSRWDRVPVGTFRLTRESAASSNDIPSSPGWTSEPPKTASSDVMSYSNVMKSSPLSTILWHDKGSSAKATPCKSRAVLISPVILPVRDGDRTPTRVPHNHDQPPPNEHQPPHKTRKESRREMKMMKRKTHGPVHHQHYHHQYHHHSHHPNMKSRSTGSVQRTNFFSSPTSVPPLNI
ncbi:hypothetical protein K503DRAFT_685572 [Rhizopogon vinicolor AM-OR11-026]|uniref:Uncharacterized protein n=1 Tax=Rhizopogon vinicolor AM-OR11-026 TaxID=1314800 RepID=A0A1B7N980_9AGAM|nr:hypothetical protein K503DRAFT_685572 [Rhizopogon vinicolor AM-OR11-026]